MNRRLTFVAAAALALGVGLGTGSAQAESETPDAQVRLSGEYWACVAVDNVGGACVGNVFESLPRVSELTP